MSSQPAPVKILTVGSALGGISSLFSKVAAINSKHGPFEVLLCAGDFFGSEEDNANQTISDEIKQLLDGKLQPPMATYIMQGEHPIPLPVIAQVSDSGGELCKNVFLLGKTKVLTITQGLRIACFGGKYDAARFNIPQDPSSHPLSSPYITSEALKSFLSNPLLSKDSATSLAAAKAAQEGTHIDILLTHLWPTSITKNSLAPLPVADATSWGSSAIEQVAINVRPRYHFAAAGGSPPLFWERKPFTWDGDNLQVTRFVSLGAFGGPEPSTGKKQRWFYAFSIAPQTPGAVPQPRPSNATPSPFSISPVSAGMKRDAETDGGDNYIFGNAHRDKKQRTENRPNNRPPSGYKCKICDSEEHYIKDCPEKSKPPEGYICRKCQQPGHLIRECPEANAVGNTGGKKPPEGYVCRACGSDGHFIKDCPQAGVNSRSGKRELRKEIGPDECWFCLSNPRLTKHLIVSIGSECYVTLPKGQLIPTSPGPGASRFQVPGGGHVLIIPISHYPTLQSVPAELSLPIITEIERYKSAIRAFYASFGSVPVVFEIARLTGKGGHAHIQVVPVPEALKDGVEQLFRNEGAETGVDWEEDPDAALDRAVKINDNYFKVDLPDGRKLVHILKHGKQFDLQIGRRVLATLMDLQERIDWKACGQTESEEKSDAAAFKLAFAQFDPAA